MALSCLIPDVATEVSLVWTWKIAFFTALVMETLPVSVMCRVEWEAFLPQSIPGQKAE